MGALAASTVNVRLSAARKLVEESRRNGLLSAEAAANLPMSPTCGSRETRLGDWLTKEQARELLMDREEGPGLHGGRFALGQAGD